MNCPKCGYKLKAKRLCILCGEAIARHHKWRFALTGNAVHKCCEAPEFESLMEKETHRLREMPLFDRKAS